jgi:hypothetical protein
VVRVGVRSQDADILLLRVLRYTAYAMLRV